MYTYKQGRFAFGKLQTRIENPQNVRLIFIRFGCYVKYGPPYKHSKRKLKEWQQKDHLPHLKWWLLRLILEQLTRGMLILLKEHGLKLSQTDGKVAILHPLKHQRFSC